jgi:hypothetical protein
LIGYTRQHFRELPLDWILTPSLDGPILVFPASDAQCEASTLEAEITELRQKFRKAFTPEHIKAISREARRLQMRRVKLACGYRWNGMRLERYVEFAPDA